MSDFLRKYGAESLIIFLASILYFSTSHNQIPWNDEIFSLIDAKKLTGINLLTRPLFYPILRLWLQFGDSLSWMRALAAIFSVFTALVIYRLGNFLFGKKEGLLASILFLLSVLAGNHAHEIRMYSMGTFLSLLGSWALTHSLHSPSTKNLTAWAGLRLLTAWTIPLSIILFVPDFILLFITFRQRRKIIISAFIRASVVFVLWAPSFYFLEKEKDKFFSDWVALRSRPDLWGSLKLYFNQFTFGAIPGKSLFLTGLSILILFLLAYLPLLRREVKMRATFALFLWGVIPYFILIFYSCFGGNLWLPRYFLFIQPYLLLSLAFGFVLLWNRSRVVCSLLLIVYFSLSVYNLSHTELTYDHSQASYTLSEEIRSHQQPNDLIMLMAAEPSRYAELFSYFYKGDKVIQPIEELGRKGNQWSVNPSDLETFFQKLSPRKRLWFIFRPAGLNPENAQSVQHFIDTHFSVLEADHYYLMNLFLLETI